MKKLPRMWDEKYTTATGRKYRRFVARQQHPDGPQLAYSWQWYTFDRKHKKPLQDVPIKPNQIFREGVRFFRTRRGVKHYLECTTVAAYRLREVELKLDRGVA
jgi:hypothetical protein